MIIYGISGLGAESRIFDHVNSFLDDPIQFVPWVPHRTEDSLKDYALRMLESMDVSRPFHLVGLSFGGMLVSEMIKKIRPQKTMLISSAACRHELPAIYRGAGRLRIVKLVPDLLLQPSARAAAVVMQWNNPNYKHMEHRPLDKDYLKWMKWASAAITEWDNETIDESVIRIHGNKDLILPKCMEVDYEIDGGTHMIITEHAEKIAAIVRKELR